MYKSLFDKFLASDHTLCVYKGDKLIFTSDRDRLLSLMEYLEKFASRHRKVVIFDKILGRAAALLCIQASCREVFSPLGSQLAADVLTRNGATYHFTRTVPCILTSEGNMCPMELLSIGKDPKEFYKAIKNLLAENP